MWMVPTAAVSTDVAIVDGSPLVAPRHQRPRRDTLTRSWTVHAAHDAAIEDYCGAWIRKYLAGYTGILNTETIGGRMIEVHLRMSDQWPDLYGAGWVDSAVRLYHERKWLFADADRRDGYSVVLFCPHGPRYRHPPPALVARVHARRVERPDHVPRGQDPGSTPCRPAASGSRS